MELLVIKKDVRWSANRKNRYLQNKQRKGMPEMVVQFPASPYSYTSHLKHNPYAGARGDPYQGVQFSEFLNLQKGESYDTDCGID